LFSATQVGYSCVASYSLLPKAWAGGVFLRKRFQTKKANRGWRRFGAKSLTACWPTLENSLASAKVAYSISL